MLRWALVVVFWCASARGFALGRRRQNRCSLRKCYSIIYPDIIVCVLCLCWKALLLRLMAPLEGRIERSLSCSTCCVVPGIGLPR